MSVKTTGIDVNRILRVSHADNEVICYLGIHDGYRYTADANMGTLKYDTTCNQLRTAAYLTNMLNLVNLELGYIISHTVMYIKVPLHQQ